MICYEEFDTHTIFPVVMPCGHTYVCCICAAKIDKCMECRASLFKDIPSIQHPDSNPNHQSNQSGYTSLADARARRVGIRTQSFDVSSRNSPRQRQQQQPIKKERIPLPKNVVLMSLIESSQLVQHHSTAHNVLITEGLQGLGLGQPSQPQLFDADDVEMNQIGIGAEIANAACGTYAVAKKEGLKIISKRPVSTSSDHTRRNSNSSNNSSNSNRNRNTINNAFSLLDDETDGKGSIVKSTSILAKVFSNDDSWKRNVEEIVVNNAKKKFHNNADDLLLSYGDRVQVVSIVDSWAKLARGYGYVFLEKESDLVKVGGALDNAASIEAMIYSLSHCHNKLMEAKTSSEIDAINLLKELQSTLLKEEDVTVIGAEAFEEDQDEERDGYLHQDYSVSFTLNGNVSTTRTALESLSVGHDERSDRSDDINVDDDDDYGGIGVHQKYQSRSLGSYQSTNRSQGNDNGIGNGIEIGNQTTSHELSYLNCGLCGLQSLISGETEAELMEDHRNDDLGINRASHGMYSSTEMVQAAQQWRKRNGKEASYYTHIDFQTGLSGHSGYQSSCAQDQKQQNKPVRKLRMSSHCGLTPKRKPRHKSTSNASYLSSGGYSSF